MKQGVIAFCLTCLVIILSGCDNSPAGKQARANRMVARNELFMKCVETATRNNTNQYRDNAEVVEKCREAAQLLI